jgi:hypothetical protein
MRVLPMPGSPMNSSNRRSGRSAAIASTASAIA